MTQLSLEKWEGARAEAFRRKSKSRISLRSTARLACVTISVTMPNIISLNIERTRPSRAFVFRRRWEITGRAVSLPETRSFSLFLPPHPPLPSWRQAPSNGDSTIFSRFLLFFFRHSPRRLSARSSSVIYGYRCLLPAEQVQPHRFDSDSLFLKFARLSSRRRATGNGRAFETSGSSNADWLGNLAPARTMIPRGSKIWRNGQNDKRWIRVGSI